MPRPRLRRHLRPDQPPGERTALAEVARAAAVAALSLLEQLESTLLASVHAERQDLYAQIIWHKRSALGIAGGGATRSEGESCAGLVSSTNKTSGGNRLCSRQRQRLRRLQLELLGSSTAASASASGGQPSGATVPKAEVAAEAYPRTRLRAVVLRWMRSSRWHRMQYVLTQSMLPKK